MRKILFVTFLIYGSFIYCQTQGCNELDTHFKSYELALKTIKSTTFSINDKCNTSKSSWINGANFYSCNKKEGFLLISTKSKTYIHKNVPINIWKEFKNTDSFGKFYNLKIKGKYQLII